MDPTRSPCTTDTVVEDGGVPQSVERTESIQTRQPSTGGVSYRADSDVESISTAIVLAVIEELDVSSESLPPLAKSISPDALDEIVRPSSEEFGVVQLSFNYAGFEVVVSGSGEFTLTPEESTE